MIIADEPTSALDVVVQRQVMETLGRVQEEIGAAVILIGHDMGLMAQFVDRVGVMYAGRLVEDGERYDTFNEPQHPYTQVLIAACRRSTGIEADQDSRSAAFAARAAARLRVPSALPARMEQCSSVVPESV